MSKHIQAYFHNEDEAEGARASLMAFQADDVEVGRLSDSVARSDWSAPAFYPMSNNGFTVATGPGTMSAQGLFHVVDMRDGDVRSDLDGSNSADADHGNAVRDDALDDAVADDTDQFQYALSAKVSDDQYERVVLKLRSLGAYIEPADM
ncbi:hypothetical protein [Paenibacillus lutimineralis]|uniref:Uncharacterized protein n=1 Tax=Paenibacillus lutimineralis TaxID=2707005 RepID=A0A3Q9IB47_9BACL|nr:hypothetical protein [Paenibacillus lutimineralis]AZS16957.1 hypothetical protein EI981_22495 [Paenibacillus lutimineralis]